MRMGVKDREKEREIKEELRGKEDEVKLREQT